MTEDKDEQESRRRSTTALALWSMAALAVYLAPRPWLGERAGESLTWNLGALVQGSFAVLVAAIIATGSDGVSHAAAGMCLLYCAQLAWLWLSLAEADPVQLDRGFVVVAIAALVAGPWVATGVAVFAIVLRSAVAYAAEPTTEAFGVAQLLDSSWVLHDPGVVALMAALLAGVAMFWYCASAKAHSVPAWAGFPVALLSEAAYAAGAWFDHRWSRSSNAPSSRCPASTRSATARSRAPVSLLSR